MKDLSLVIIAFEKRRRIQKGSQLYERKCDEFIIKIQYYNQYL